VLGHAGLLDVAGAAEHLERDRGDLDPQVGSPALGDRGEQVGQLGPLPAHGPIGMVRGQVEGLGVQIDQAAQRLVVRPHGQQHAPDVGEFDER
jgi:hypothetical protein